MKWVIIVKFTEGVRQILRFDSFDEAVTELYKWNHEYSFSGRTPIKVTIEKMVVIE